MADIWTARVSYRGADRLDITRKGDSPFGPSWALLRRFLAIRVAGQETEATWAEYSAAYTQEMRGLYRRDPGAFSALAEQGGTLCCYCTGAHCHRYLLAAILQRLGATYQGER